MDELHKLLVIQEVLVVEELQQQQQVQQVLQVKDNQVEQLVQDLTLLVVVVELRKQVLLVQVVHLVQE